MNPRDLSAGGDGTRRGEPIRAVGEVGNCNFACHAVDPSDERQQRTADLTENSTPNTALSLDEKASKGQSVGQHVCTG
jgi:hypothetical protein